MEMLKERIPTCRPEVNRLWVWLWDRGAGDDDVIDGYRELVFFCAAAASLSERAIALAMSSSSLPTLPLSDLQSSFAPVSEVETCHILEIHVVSETGYTCTIKIVK